MTAPCKIKNLNAILGPPKVRKPGTFVEPAEQGDLVLLLERLLACTTDGGHKFLLLAELSFLAQIDDRIGQGRRCVRQRLHLVEHVDRKLLQGRIPQQTEELVKYRFSLVPLMVPVHVRQTSPKLVAKISNLHCFLYLRPER